MDLIDRQALLKQIEIDSDGEPGYYGDTWKFIDTIKRMPSELSTNLASLGTDCISRQAAISAICNACGKIDCDKMDKCEKLQLPPANNSEIPNSSDTISRQAAIDALRAMQTYKLFAGDDMLLIDQAEAQTELMMLPPAQPERIKGRWIYHPEWANDGECGYECSVCHMGSDIGYNFCMRCGADMREVTT